jgi:exopolyphosphatase/guanosine-5'-triphosphate,3'-diphosphate pyrophosphatase
MDIGGGSVEFIIANRDRIAWKRSYDIGAQRLLDWFHQTDPIPQNELARLFEFFEQTLAELSIQMEKYKPNCLIGSSGTYDTLSEIYQYNMNRFASGDETELPLSPMGFQNIYEQIVPLNRVQRLRIPGMMEMRADMIVVASCLVKYTMDKFHIQQIRVSAHSLKEGMITVLQEEMTKHNKVSIFGN